MSAKKQTGLHSLYGGKKAKIEQLRHLAVQELGQLPARLDDLIDDVCALYEGKWDTHQKCQVGYHTLTHSLDVALAAGRMIAGWNRLNEPIIGENLLLSALAAALFHDSGYLKDKDDHEGKGGKYTFNHVPRSMGLADLYLGLKGWPEEMRRLVHTIISLTEFHDFTGLQQGKFREQQEGIVAKMVATADLIAQMSDVHYMEHIEDLYQEFAEAYDAEGRENLTRRGIHIFGSVEEMVNGTVTFYRDFVLPRLAELGGMSRYLIAYYGEDRNPYLESIAANLAGEASGYQLRWRRIGEILTELGAVTEKQIEHALNVQQNNQNKEAGRDGSLDTLKNKANRWVERQLQGDCLGDILMQNTGLSPSVLRQGVISQVLPEDFTNGLDSRELLLLLQILILLQNINNGRWIFHQLLTLVNEILQCEASSILQADGSGRSLQVTHASGYDHRRPPDKRVAIDKGLAGWVFLHGKPSTINRTELEHRREDGQTESDQSKNGAMLAVPLNIAGQRIGVIEALNKREGNFTAHDMNILSLIGNLLSQSLPAALWL